MGSEGHGLGKEVIAKNFGWLLADRAFRLVVGLAIGSAIARYLGPLEYGKLAYVLAVVALLQGAAPLGMDSITVREVSRNPARAGIYLGTVFWLRICGSVLAYAVAVMLFWGLRLDESDILRLGVTVSLILIVQTTDVMDLWFQARAQSGKTVRAKFAVFGLVSIFRLLAIWSVATVHVLAWILLFEAVLNALALWLTFRGAAPIERWGWSKRVARRFAARALPLFFAAVALGVYSQLDRLLLEKFVGTATVGIYSAALMLSGVANFLPMALGSSLAPNMARLRTEEQQSVFFTALVSTFFWVSVAFSTCLLLGAKWLVIWLLGDRYVASILLVQILAVSFVPISISVAHDYYALSCHRQSDTLYRTLIGLVTGAFLGVTLIPTLGVVGAAVATLVAHICSSLVFCWIRMPQTWGFFVEGLTLPLRWFLGKRRAAS